MIPPGARSGQHGGRMGMKTRRQQVSVPLAAVRAVAAVSAVVVAVFGADIAGQGQAPAAASRKAAYRAPRTAWGQPDIHGDYTNKDEANTPLERPQQLAGKDPSTFTEADLAQLAK